MKPKTFIFTFCFLLFTFYLYSQPYSIPGASQQPAWVFPIYFKDGTGARDTVYIGYDPAATGNLDTIFGMKYISIDTSKFNVAFDCGGLDGDTTLKVAVMPEGLLGFGICPYKARMPVTMYWHDSLFYSDSLPFPDLSPLPRARGDLWCGDWNPDYNNCPVNFPIIMTDNPDSLFFAGSPRIESDSIFFDGDTTDYMGTALNIFIVPYDKPNGIEEKHSKLNDPVVYPNPAQQVLYFRNDLQKEANIKIFNYQGKLIRSLSITERSIDISGFSQGFYFLQITYNNILSTTCKFIKL